jgi:hypothetical protein
MVNSSRFKTAHLKLFGALCILIAAAFSAQASDADRINQLEKELQEIKQRLSVLESPSSSSNARQIQSPPGEGWKSVSNWRKLNTGMSHEEVRSLLGEPQRINGGEFSFWQYSNRGEVIFVRAKVYEWKEPK